ncbi:MAG: hypothetical protein NZ992_00055 [Candidatus Korarchaeum sp.]|nr:hypothetical protein [Candidatus Korarchaeum sp.]MDW8093359.1 hypothetical protein [Nitrososphaerota archaeon]
MSRLPKTVEIPSINLGGVPRKKKRVKRFRNIFIRLSTYKMLEDLRVELIDKYDMTGSVPLERVMLFLIDYYKKNRGECLV